MSTANESAEEIARRFREQREREEAAAAAAEGPPAVAPWDLPQLPIAILYALAKSEDGVPLTPGQQQTWEAYQHALGLAETRRSQLGLVDLGEVMTQGVTDPTMLVPKLLVAGEHHYVYGNKESMKTWLLLWCAAFVMVDRPVVWVDKEMGRKNLANRMLALGVPAEVVSERFIYLEHPAMDCSQQSVSLWTALLQHREPALVIVDAQTEVLADAGLNENSGTDIEKWAQAYITPARRQGCTTVMIDHTGHQDQTRAVGSRQKGASAKVELRVKRVGKANREKTATVYVTCRKNTVSADVPDEQTFKMGGDGSDTFVLLRTPTPGQSQGHEHDDDDGPSDTVLDAAAKLTARTKVLAFLRENEDVSFSNSELRKEKLCHPTHLRPALNELTDDSDEPVRCVQQPDAQGRGGRWRYET